jgi:hypothetical protein
MPDDVLQENGTWCSSANQSEDFGPEVRVMVGSLSVAGVAPGLAGVSGGEEVEVPELGALERAYVVMPWHLWPVLLEDANGERVNLHLANAGVSSSLQSKVNPSDAGE